MKCKTKKNQLKKKIQLTAGVIIFGSVWFGFKLKKLTKLKFIFLKL
jgi:hypothetical protein